MPIFSPLEPKLIYVLRFFGIRGYQRWGADGGDLTLDDSEVEEMPPEISVALR